MLGRIDLRTIGGWFEQADMLRDRQGLSARPPRALPQPHEEGVANRVREVA